MLFDDPSCLPASSLQTHLDNGFAELLELDWCCIVSVTFGGKLSVDASRGITEAVQNEVCLTLLEDHKDTFLEDRCTCVAFGAGEYFFARYRIRSASTYEVFYVAVRQGAPFTDKETKWINLYFLKAYSNVLLNHEVFQQNEYIESVFNSIEASIFVLDLTLMLVSYNVQAKDLLPAGAPDEKTHYSLSDIPFTDFDSMEGAIRYVLEGNGKKYLSNIVVRDKKGTNRIFYVTIAPLRDSKGCIAGVVAVCNDVTKLRVIQKEMTILEQYGLLGEVALGVSHDVKNPLMNINSCVHYLKCNWAKEIDYQRYCALVLQETARISATVDQLMSFGHISSESTAHLVNINEILLTCIQIVERQRFSSQRREISIESHFSKTIPPVKARALDLQQAFLNILLNALQSIDAVGSITVSSRHDKKNSCIAVTIADTGCGISEDQMQDLFFPYQTSKKEGKGLGLFLTKRTLERYRGELKIKSKVGLGTTCVITLPIDDEP